MGTSLSKRRLMSSQTTVYSDDEGDLGQDLVTVIALTTGIFRCALHAGLQELESHHL